MRASSLGAAAATAVLAGVLVTPAGAAPRPAFSLTAASSAPYPQLVARPGRTVWTSVCLRSRSERAQVVRLQAVDPGTSNLGGIEFPSSAAKGAGTWLRLTTRDVRLAPRQAVTLRLAATVPVSAHPGEHYAGLVAVDRAELRRARAKPSAKHPGVVLHRLTRIALPVRFVLPGRAARTLALRNITFAADAAGSRIDVGMRNTGQRLVRSAAVDLRVSSGDKPLFRHRAALSEVLPGTGMTYPVAWRGAAPADGTYRVTGTITPKGAPPIRVDQRVRFGTAEAAEVEHLTGTPPTSTQGLSWPLLAAVSVLVLLAACASAGYLRLRRRLASVAS